MRAAAERSGKAKDAWSASPTTGVPEVLDRGTVSLTSSFVTF
jgi:hypothetical protein